MRPFLIVLSAPSGGGKTTIARALLSGRSDISYSVSATTRSPRTGEEDGRDYHFLSAEEFDRRIEAGDFLEWATYGGNRYGTLEAEVNGILEMGRHVLLDIEIQGARSVRQKREDVVSIFIVPPSAEILVDRLGGRDSESTAELVPRLRTAVAELREAGAYDYVVMNRDRTQAVAEVAAIIDAESRRPARDRGLTRELEKMGSELEVMARRLEEGEIS